jgi:membrane associated rhomboid family serine protease
MWTLFIFGDNVEDRIGSFRFLLFYLFGGIVANLMQAFVFQESTIPAVGASGAIAAVLGAYLVLFPRARVITLIVIFFFPWFVEISAIFYLGFWFVTQLYSGVFAWGCLKAPRWGVSPGGRISAVSCLACC